MKQNIDHYEFLNIPRTSDSERINEAILDHINNSALSYDFLAEFEDNQSQAEEFDQVKAAQEPQESRIIQVLRDFEDDQTKLDYDRCLLNVEIYGSDFEIPFAKYQKMMVLVDQWFGKELESLRSKYILEISVWDKMLEVGTITQFEKQLKNDLYLARQNQEVSKLQRLKQLKRQGLMLIRDKKLKKLH